MTTRVLKLGGAALAHLSHFEKIVEIIADQKKSCENLVVVVSAMGDMTDHLLELAHAIDPHPPKREQDMLLSVGERISMALLAMALKKHGLKALSLTGSQSGVMTSPAHTEAEVLEVRTHRVKKHLEEGNIVIVAGFQGVSLDGEITTLGRGGSDTTAVALGVALRAEGVWFYKDVDGIYTSDPKLSPDAQKLKHISYDVALPLCEKGGVIHARAVSYAKKHKLTLEIRSFSGVGLGSTIDTGA